MKPTHMDMTARQTGAGALLLAVIAMLPLCAIALVLGEGELVAGLAPLLVLIAAVAVLKLPIRVTLTALIFLMLTVDNPMERPAVGLWQSPLYPIGKLLFVNLSKNTGISALAFSVVDLLMVVLLILSWVRTKKESLPPVKPLVELLLISFAWILFLEAWGLVRGGADFKASLWQIRAPLFTPLVCYLMIRAFNRAEDCVPLAKMVVVAACIKALIGFYFFWFIMRPLHEKPQYVTSHADTMLYAVTVGICVNYWLESRRRRALWLNALVLPIVMIGMITNDRRLVWVSLAGGFATVFALMTTHVRRQVLRLGLFLLPFIAVYFAVGLKSRSAIFLPVQRVMSVAMQEDRSSGTRDIENYNLIKTLKKNPILGMGFGHEYEELVQADDISRIFALYKYIAHNSVLWLWAVAGWAGFTAIWLYLTGIVFLAVRTYRATTVPIYRTAALTALFAVIAYMLQAYGDMGMENWTGVLLVAMSAAVVSRLALHTGAWPRKSTA